MAGGDNVAVPVVEMVFVDFHLRPEFLVDAVLQGVIPGQSVSDEGYVSCGQAEAQRSLHVEFAETLSVGNGGRDDGTERALLVLAGRKSHLVEGGQDVVAVFLIASNDSIFHQE